MNERIIEKLKILVGTIENEITISLVLDILIQKIKNYCNREDIPTELELVIVEMLAEYNKSLSSSGQDTQNTGGIKSITRGNTKIEYNVSTNTKITSVDDLISKYKTHLIRFKKVGTIRMNGGN
ncbi:hypothetical protein [Peptostreptococcus sp. D1]|uniref:hypothetical protein n=1 Tax=Peptostreptococcus sp. D1 TaxID=72304 RepID=UPI0008E25AD0|nr:hypothetical protein [Peptostreptococcus sp. D1]SFE38263.1 hypothetical protein SAMN02910278_00736 [Peptostreptococcus sp. D1]